MKIEDVLSDSNNQEVAPKLDKSNAQADSNIYKFCPGCGFNNDKLFKFCPGCGNSLLAN